MRTLVPSPRPGRCAGLLHERPGLLGDVRGRGVGWIALDRGETEIAIGEGEPETGEESPVATIDVDDVKAERERLAQAQVEVGTVLELHGTMRLLDVFDPDGNRLQLAQDLS